MYFRASSDNRTLVSIAASASRPLAGAEDSPGSIRLDRSQPARHHAAAASHPANRPSLPIAHGLRTVMATPVQKKNERMRMSRTKYIPDESRPARVASDGPPGPQVREGSRA